MSIEEIQQPEQLTPLDHGFVERRGPDRPFQGAPIERLGEVTVELSVEVGRARMTLTQALGLGPGAIVGLDRMHGEAADLLCNGKRIARGEVVVVDDEFGLRITEVMAPTGASAASAGAAAPGEETPALAVAA